eukprot:gnl/TRDRNA2_/TRDRNA2_171305_c1_seq7.p1 gnl/TRDRNA2_/TRDRNA2_171305_c1~~gnl/TRDRNA2_/TRDRNA2_171305_c1_seq7.p1  ORF type:complete len:300 (-),score=52.44 gnl/TRDRNA2_/TRDRNA2_171305_c1_seq7:358-1197(-)
MSFDERVFPGTAGMRRTKEDEEEQEKKRAKTDGAPNPMAFKFLAPKTLANALEAFARVIEEAMDGKVEISPSDDFFPGTSSRVVSLESSKDDGIMLGLKRVLSVVSECSECLTEHEGEYLVTVVMPSKSVSALIGVRGANVQVLQKNTGVHIHVDGEALGFGPGGDRAVKINGTTAALEIAMVRIIECVAEFKDQPWFVKWAERSNPERQDATKAPPLPNMELPQREGFTNAMLSNSGLNANSITSTQGSCSLPSETHRPLWLEIREASPCDVQCQVTW